MLKEPCTTLYWRRMQLSTFHCYTSHPLHRCAFSALATHRGADGWVGNGLWTCRQPENEGCWAKNPPFLILFLTHSHSGWMCCKGCWLMQPVYRLQAVDLRSLQKLSWTSAKPFLTPGQLIKQVCNTIKMRDMLEHTSNCSIF